jgi:hypothetical protein
MPERKSDFQRHSAVDERLSGWRRVVAKAQDAERYSQHPRAEETAVLRVLTILLWLFGLGSCFLLAWRGSGESVIVTGLIMLLPCAAWVIFGLSPWALLLPISLIAALALQGALLVW